MKRIVVLTLIAALLLGLTACGQAEPEAKTVNLQELYASFESSLPAMIVLDETMMLNFLGIRAEDCTQVVAAICADGLRTDEIWLVEAKDQAAYEKLSALVDTRLIAKKDETISYAPDQYAVCEKAVILNNGLYLAFLVSPDVDTLKAACESAFN